MAVRLPPFLLLFAPARVAKPVEWLRTPAACCTDDGRAMGAAFQASIVATLHSESQS